MKNWFSLSIFIVRVGAWYTFVMNFSRYVVLGSLLLSFAGHVAAQEFTRTLKIGMRGEDVRALQRALNENRETRIAESGPGSPGAETDYFGPATKRALIRFQEQHAAEVLAPLGLSYGTGVFGEKSRNLLGILMAGSVGAPMINPPRIPPPLFPSPGIEERSSVVEAHYPSMTSGIVGTKILLKGIGFTPADNTIIFKRDGSDSDAATISGVSSWNTLETALFAVPNVPKGIYYLFVRNAHGESKKYPFFVVTDGATPEPVIESVTPATMKLGSEITIHGSGFTKIGNMVRTSINIVENIPSVDGKTLIFTIPRMGPDAQTLDELKKTLPAGTVVKTMAVKPETVKPLVLSVYARVVNENGVSGQKSFTVQF